MQLLSCLFCRKPTVKYALQPGVVHPSNTRAAELPLCGISVQQCEALQYEELSSKYGTSTHGVIVLARPPAASSCQQPIPVPVYKNGLFSAVVGALSFKQHSTAPDTAASALGALAAWEPALYLDVCAHLQRVAAGDPAGSLALYLPAHKYPPTSAPVCASRGADAGNPSPGCVPGAHRAWTYATVEPASYLPAPISREPHPRGGSVSRLPLIPPTSSGGGAAAAHGRQLPGHAASGSSSSPAARWPAVVVTFFLADGRDPAAMEPLRAQRGESGLRLAPCLDDRSAYQPNPLAAHQPDDAALEITCAKDAGAIALFAMDPRGGGAAAAGAAGKQPPAGAPGAVEGAGGVALLPTQELGGMGSGSKRVASGLAADGPLLPQSPRGAAAGMQNGAGPAAGTGKRSGEVQSSLAATGGAAAMAAATATASATALRMREGMVLSGLTPIVTAFTVSGKDVLYQNAASIAYYGPRVATSTGIFSAADAAEAQDSGCFAGADGGLLRELFALEPGKLDRMMVDVCIEGRIWKGIVHVPVSCVSLDSPFVSLARASAVHSSGHNADAAVASGPAGPSGSAAGAARPPSLALALPARLSGLSLSLYARLSARRSYDSGPATAATTAAAAAAVPTAAAGQDRVVSDGSSILNAAALTAEGPLLDVCSPCKVVSVPDMSPLATSTWGLLMDTEEQTDPTELPGRAVSRQPTSTQLHAGGKGAPGGPAGTNTNAGGGAGAEAPRSGLGAPSARSALTALLSQSGGGARSEAEFLSIYPAPRVPPRASRPLCAPSRAGGALAPRPEPAHEAGATALASTPPAAAAAAATAAAARSGGLGLACRDDSQIGTSVGGDAAAQQGQQQQGRQRALRRCVTRGDLRSPGGPGQATITRVVAFASSLKSTPADVQIALQAAFGGGGAAAASGGEPLDGRRAGPQMSLDLPRPTPVAALGAAAMRGPQMSLDLPRPAFAAGLPAAVPVPGTGTGAGTGAGIRALPVPAAHLPGPAGTMAEEPPPPPPEQQQQQQQEAGRVPCEGGPRAADGRPKSASQPQVPAEPSTPLSGSPSRPAVKTTPGLIGAKSWTERSIAHRLSRRVLPLPAAAGQGQGAGVAASGGDERLLPPPIMSGRRALSQDAGEGSVVAAGGASRRASACSLGSGAGMAAAADASAGAGGERMFSQEAGAAAGGGGASAVLASPPRAYCWHELCASRAVDPVTGQFVIVLTQTDVTAKVEAERHIAFVTEAEHRLLEQIFPRHVLAYMTEEGGPWASPEKGPAPALRRPMVRDINKLATSHEEVTLLFADIQGFTPMCKVLEPRVVMAFLNDLFTRFDKRLDEFGVYKVETIGDCYFVAGGLIQEDESGMPAVRARHSHADPLHAEKVFMFAKAMLSIASQVRLPTTGGPVRMRIGIHSGPVVSGVVGQRMPRFCLFGDTVNTTSRMESSGVPGCIHASDAAHAFLRGEAWVPTGGIEVKGKGLMNTYLWAPPDPDSQALLARHAVSSPRGTADARLPGGGGGGAEENGGAVAGPAAACSSQSQPDGTVDPDGSGASTAASAQRRFEFAQAGAGGRRGGGGGPIAGLLESASDSSGGGAGIAGGSVAQMWSKRSISLMGMTESVAQLASLLLRAEEEE